MKAWNLGKGKEVRKKSPKGELSKIGHHPCSPVVGSPLCERLVGQGTPVDSKGKMLEVPSAESISHRPHTK